MTPSAHRTARTLAVCALLLAVGLSAGATETDGEERSFALHLTGAGDESTKVTVRYTVWGEASSTTVADLVLIHGWASDRFAFRPVLERPDAASLLLRNRRVLAVELRHRRLLERR